MPQHPGKKKSPKRRNKGLKIEVEIEIEKNGKKLPKRMRKKPARKRRK